jgi:hypothetical protein
MKIPNNSIQYNYTSGNEFVNPDTNVPYQGYYYETNGVYFTGRTFNPNAPKIIKKVDENRYLNDLRTATYAKLTGYTTQKSNEPKITSMPTIGTDNISLDYEGPRFFAQKINTTPIIIKEIDEKTYTSLQNSPFYKTTYVSKTQSAIQAEAQIPGLQAFLKG